MTRRVTLKDIAARLDLSVSAISKALHNDPSISGSQRERIHQLAELLGYRPDPGLVALAAYRLKSGIRGVFASCAFVGFQPQPEDENAAIFRGAQGQAGQLGYHLGYYHLSPQLSLRRHAHVLLSQGVRGLVLAPLPAGMMTLDWDWSLFNVVAIGNSLQHPRLHRASPDTFEALALAVEKVEGLGYKRVGIAITREQNIQSGRRWIAAAAMLQEKATRSGDRLIIFRDSSGKAAGFLSWLRKTSPEVLICLRNPAPQWIQSARPHIPRDMRLVCLDRTPSMWCPGIEQNLQRVGVAGMDLLHASLIQGETGIPELRQSLLIQPQWAEGSEPCPGQFQPRTLGLNFDLAHLRKEMRKKDPNSNGSQWPCATI
jgi:LacI family transcriptional regulator